MPVSHPTTISMQNAPMAAWLERAPADAETLALRARLISDVPGVVLGLLPQGEAATLELGCILAARDGLTPPTTARDALMLVGRNYVEDICILTKDGSGPYLLTAGVICFPNRWRLSEKLGKPMLAVHDPVPEYAEKLGAQVDFFLDRLRPGRCFKRANWGLASAPTLHLPDPIPPVNTKADADFYFRHEGQSFVKLPDTGAVIFSIRTTITPWRDVPEGDRTAVLALVQSIGPDWLRYKSITA
ncbi:MAG: DUF3445 domain-containing protein [Rhodospirillaceae bacterium]|nr:DUF3445 domain-containing protein [Rhodospirillaceae bacterium]